MKYTFLSEKSAAEHDNAFHQQSLWPVLLDKWQPLAEHLDHGSANHDTEGKRFKFPIHCCDVTKAPYLISGELCTSPLHCWRTPCAVGAPSSASLCSEHIKSDVVDGSSGRRYVTDQWHNVPLLRARDLDIRWDELSSKNLNRISSDRKFS